MKELKTYTQRTQADDAAVYQTVAEIISRVRKEKDTAVSFYNEKFGGLPVKNFRVPEKAMDEALASVSPELLSAMKLSAQNIERFAREQRNCIQPLKTEVMQGVALGHYVIPVDSACCYVPGGNHPLFSTALMLAIPAKVAGVPRICACVPPMKSSTLPHPATLVALRIAGVDEVYAIGGAQAIAAVAYGTETIKPVDVIVGPGNKFVTEAKRQVFGRVGIDFIAGPSEVLVIADENAKAEIIAADLLAQSEHDKDAAGILITTSEALAKAVETEVERQLKTLDTADIALVSWKNNGRIILADNLDEAADIANEIAPEHLEIDTSNAEQLAQKLRNFGSLFIGQGSAEVFGDYDAGTNHTLPTRRAARYTGGVSVLNFLKICTWQNVSKTGISNIGQAAVTMAENEGLSAHANAARIRLK